MYHNPFLAHLILYFRSIAAYRSQEPPFFKISLMDHKPRQIVNDLRLINLETNLACYIENVVFSALYKDKTDNEDDGNFKIRRHFSLLHSLRSNATTKIRPAAHAYSQRCHLLFSWVLSAIEELKAGYQKNLLRASTRSYKFYNNRRFPSKLPSANLQVTCAPASYSLAPQNSSYLHDNRSLINKHLTFTLRHDHKRAGLLRDVNIQA